MFLHLRLFFFLLLPPSQPPPPPFPSSPILDECADAVPFVMSQRDTAAWGVSSKTAQAAVCFLLLLEVKKVQQSRKLKPAVNTGLCVIPRHFAAFNQCVRVNNKAGILLLQNTSVR